MNGFDLNAIYEKKHGKVLPKKPIRKKEKVDINSVFDIEATRSRLHDPTALDWETIPVNFKEFCESKEHMDLLPDNWKEGDEGALSERQYQDCMEIVGKDPKKMFDPDRKYKLGVFLWAKGCITGDTELFDETLKIKVPIKTLYLTYKNLVIKCYNQHLNKVVTKQVQNVISKGIAKILKIKTVNGLIQRVAEDHLLFTNKGYLEAHKLKISDKIGINENNKIKYDHILTITEDGEEEVFDLTIDDETPNYFTANGILHHNSGKDYICSIIHTYLIYIMLCLKNPPEFFGFGPGEPCDILNVGKKGEQAAKVYFSKFRSRILNWKWMRDRYNIIDEGKIFHKRGREFPTCVIGKKAAEWSNKRVRAFSENSGNPQSLEGYNIVFYICDEISGWMSEKERELAEEILGILRTSQGSRNTRTLKGLGMIISYPRQDDDIMFRLEEEAKDEKSGIFFSRGLQEQIKPKRFYSGKTFRFNAGTDKVPEIIDVPVELDEEFFKNNPEKAKMVYLLKPPAVGAQYFEYPDKIDFAAKKERQRLFKVETDYIESRDGDGGVIYYVRKRIVGLNRQPNMDADYVAWIDAGESTCDASLSIGHLEWVKLIEGSVAQDVECVILDDTLVWEPDQKLKRIVDIGSMSKACLDMLRYIPLKAVWWDQWNSGTGVFDLRQAKVNCDKHNLVGDDYGFFKTILYTNRFIAPECPDVEKGIAQIKHLTRTRTNNVTTGSTKHKKDIADTWCGVTTLLLGSLVQNIQFRRGKAPTSITIMGGGRAAGVTGSGYQNVSMGAASNPFSNPMGNNVAKRVIGGSGHSDLFPSLMGTGSRSSGSRTKSEQARPNAKTNFPRGIRA